LLHLLGRPSQRQCAVGGLRIRQDEPGHAFSGFLRHLAGDEGRVRRRPQHALHVSKGLGKHRNKLCLCFEAFDGTGQQPAALVQGGQCAIGSAKVGLDLAGDGGDFRHQHG
jgi:hypothetical protein